MFIDNVKERLLVDANYLAGNFRRSVRQFNNEVMTGETRELAFRWSDSVHERWREILGKDPEEIDAVDMSMGLILLVKEGFAWETVSYYGLGSHPELAQMVFDASAEVGDPNFQEPYQYKKDAQPCQ